MLRSFAATKIMSAGPMVFPEFSNTLGLSENVSNSWTYRAKTID
jgi:hypothetical protein